MTGLEITLLVAGSMIMAAGFIFPSGRDDKKDTDSGKTELTEKQKEAIEAQIREILDEKIDEAREKTEISFDRLSNQKMLEMNEYSDTILAEINRNHNEVMFLYDMLNEKKKEINIAVRDINIAKKEIEKIPKTPESDNMEEPGGFMQSEQLLKEEQKKNVLNQLDAVVEAVSDDIEADEETVVTKKTRKRTATAKTAVKRTRETVKKESVREEQKAADGAGGNNNERILALSSQGKSAVDIAKELGIGFGEVKLVLDLFRGGRQ